MQVRRLNDLILGWLRAKLARGTYGGVHRRGSIDHVIILDGTMSTLRPGHESNAGMTFKLLREAHYASVYYEAGGQWRGWRDLRDIVTGRGINRKIKRAYGYLASRYRPGDRIFLLGYSRGAYAVRSLAGMIDRVGLLRAEHATERNIRQIYRHYRQPQPGPAAGAFSLAYCHAGVEIEMLGVWDTVKALGLRLPLLWQLTEGEHAFHNHDLGPVVKRGYQALAMDETREAFAPVLWTVPPEHRGVVEQVWFRGSHGDVGGQLGGVLASRPLANIPLVWMLDRLEACDVSLPEGWQARFPRDPEAPACGTWTGAGKLFLLRRQREIGLDRSERLHETARSAPDGAEVI
ncbi:DUF2235 domain-containing protein [Salipiger mucosus]|uniref:Peptidoglycan binding protein domain protein n=1 Tax=Salipiger mucosus DSM 16094 TaxID=1123237 RepID=S9RCW7_9RHOB|nr:DUF2235 domain-containing protein [Salipiger mucosus]EPX75970.1 peptidoglycan binding protein domain protein [Salipiger mucosus DSM 16094]